MSRYVQIKQSISADGLGKPVLSIFFSYCDKKDKTGTFCPMCQNKELQKDGVGYYLDYHDIVELLDRKLKYWESALGKSMGVCFLGGEPLAEINRGMVKRLSNYYKDRFQILYTWREVGGIEKEWIKDINKVVCGEYIEKLATDDSYILGSSNQYIIDGNTKI